MGMGFGMVEEEAANAASSERKSFADRMAKKLHVKAAMRDNMRHHPEARALKDMAEVFKSEGWRL